jgi:hypothetical protein
MPCSFSASITETIFCSILWAASVLSCFGRAEDQACVSIIRSRSIALKSRMFVNSSIRVGYVVNFETDICALAPAIIANAFGELSSRGRPACRVFEERCDPRTYLVRMPSPC